MYALAEALIAKQPYGDRTLIAELQWISAGLIGDHLRDITRGSDHYLTTALYRVAPPAWTKFKDGTVRPAVCTVASHLFFRLNQ